MTEEVELFAISGYRTRKAAEEAAARWADVYPPEQIVIELESVFYVLYLPCKPEEA